MKNAVGDAFRSYFLSNYGKLGIKFNCCGFHNIYQARFEFSEETVTDAMYESTSNIKNIDAHTNPHLFGYDISLIDECVII